MSKNGPLQLAAHGLSAKDLAVLRSLLLLYRNRLNRECQLCLDVENADVHLIDIDEPAGRAKWEALRERARCIVFSHTAAETPLLLNKPLRGPTLLAALNAAVQSTKRHTAETVPHSKPHAAMNGQPLIDLLESDAIDSPVRIATPNWDDDLWIDPELRQYLLGTTLAHLHDFLRMPLAAPQLQPISREDFRQQSQRIRPQTLTRLRWSSALACSAGRLHCALDRSVPMRLTSWPDMEEYSPAFFRMAGLLLKHSVTFDVIVNATGVGEATAADFVNASYRSGLIKQSRLPLAGSGFAFARHEIVARLRQRLGL
jgi:hypothetical protein